MTRGAIFGAVLFAFSRLSVDLEELGDIVLEPLPLAVAFVLLSGSWVLSALAWLVLFDVGLDRRGLTSAYAIGQLAKYVPGGVAQVAGQIARTRRVAGFGVAGASVAFLISTFAAAEAAFILSAVSLGWQAEVLWLYLSLPAALIGAFALHPRSLRAIIRRLPNRIEPQADALPTSGQIAASVSLYAVSLLSSGAAFVFVLRAVGGSVGMSSLFAFSTGWVVGLLVLPIPAGLGVREAVMVVLTPSVPSAVVLVAVVAHRIVTLASEVLPIALTARWTAPAPNDE